MPQHNDCIFCQIIRGESDADVIYETDDVIAFRDIHPKAPTHVLIVPKKHISKLSEMEPEDTDIMGKVMLAAGHVAEQENRSDFNLVLNNGRAAGQTVYHVHVHLLAGGSGFFGGL